MGTVTRKKTSDYTVQEGLQYDRTFNEPGRPGTEQKYEDGDNFDRDERKTELAEKWTKFGIEPLDRDILVRHQRSRFTRLPLPERECTLLSPSLGVSARVCRVRGVPC